jgi:RNase H-like domain found in reverse transcriptase
MRTLRKVFDRLKAAGLKVKYAKCVWAAAECRVLGSIVGQDGIKPDPEKVSAIEALPIPRNIAELRSFLGATGWFHEHIPKYAAVSAPLRQLLKRAVAYKWTDECQEAFLALKAALQSDACLRMPDPTRPFILTTDWSKLAIGAVLSQLQPVEPHQVGNTDSPSCPEREYVIAYASKALTEAQSHYAPTEGECLALVWATKKFRHYLHGRRFLARTDHHAIRWLASARYDNSKLERWSMRLQGFDFTVDYIPGLYSR